MTRSTPHFEAIVIGTGFAGAVTACRLAQAKMKVCVLERGRKFANAETDLPVYPKPARSEAPGAETGEERSLPDFSRLLWGVSEGLWDLRDLGDVLVAQAAGYGGGSLIYANVHLRAPGDVFDERWPERYKNGGLDPYYDLAAYMLDVQMMPDPPKAGGGIRKAQLMESAAAILNDEGKVVEYLRPPLAINFEGEERKKNRWGRDQGVCDFRGDCCFGCGEQAKNTLDLNYLAIAEDAETDSREDHTEPCVDIRTLAEVVSITEVTADDPATYYKVEYRDRLLGLSREVTADCVFLCAGAVNTTELLIRSRDAGKLRCTGTGLGSRFFSNADALGAVFDCDDLQEVDRGPTITSALLYDRLPGNDDSVARWTMPFAKGEFLPAVGCILEGEGGGEAEIVGEPVIESGSWAVGTATGEWTLSRVTGDFKPDQNILWRCPAGGDPEQVAVCVSEPRKARHWLMLQDGGMPSELEPLLGIFRSPLWLRRNRYREEPSKDVTTQNGAYARLPFDTLTDALSNLTTSAVQPGLRTPSPVGRHLAFRSARETAPLPESSSKATTEKREAQLQHFTDPIRAWSTLPDQLRNGLLEWKDDLLDLLSAGAEPMVGRFLEEAGDLADENLDLEALIRQFPLGGGFDPSAIRRVQITERALRMGVQMIWGSQGEMIRHGTEKFLVSKLIEDDGFHRRITEMLQWALDYRVGDGHTGLVLSMGRDTLPGRLSLESWDEPARGSRIVGQMSAASRVLVRAEVKGGTSWSRGDAQGELVVVKAGGDLLRGETLLLGDRDLGVFKRESEVGLPERFEGLTLVEFEPRSVDDGDPQSRPPQPPLRADLPPPLAATEWATQELLLRDLAKSWNGELRTDPMWSFLRRRVTVHAQGGCPMGPNAETGFTDENGLVFGCEGLYVMDAAAFPTSVGVNPSATITAVAELKIESFIRSRLENKKWQAPKRKEAVAWAATRMDWLHPEGLRQPRSSVGPRSRPVAIEFSERMHGFGLTPSKRGSTPGNRVEVEANLDVTIRDLSRFLDLDRKGRPEPLEVQEGEVAIQGLAGVPDKLIVDVDRGGSHIWLRQEPVAGGRERRTMEYRLRLISRQSKSGTGSTKAKRYVLTGNKIIRDDDHFDVWEDSTTLFFELKDDGKNVLLKDGVLRLSAEDFFASQLPGTKAIGTDDKSRQCWALAAFGKFYFGHLVDVYVPELDRFVDVVKSISEATHV